MSIFAKNAILEKTYEGSGDETELSTNHPIDSTGHSAHELQFHKV